MVPRKIPSAGSSALIPRLHRPRRLPTAVVVPRRVHAQAPLKQDGVPDLLHRNVVINESATNMSDKARSCPMHINTVESGSGLLDYGSCNADRDRFESNQHRHRGVRLQNCGATLHAWDWARGSTTPELRNISRDSPSHGWASSSVPMHNGFKKSVDYK